MSVAGGAPPTWPARARRPLIIQFGPGFARAVPISRELPAHCVKHANFSSSFVSLHILFAGASAQTQIRNAAARPQKNQVAAARSVRPADTFGRQRIESGRSAVKQTPAPPRLESDLTQLATFALLPGPAELCLADSRQVLALLAPAGTTQTDDGHEMCI